MSAVIDRADDDIARLCVPPHSIEAEQSVLGGLLLDNSAWDRAGDLLTDSDFHRYDHKAIYKAIGDLVQASKPADVITVYEQLQNHGKAEECGGIAYLNALAQSVPSAANLRRYAEIVRERAVLRKLIEVGHELATSAYNAQDRSALQILDEAQRRVLSINEQAARDGGGLQALDGLMAQFVDRVTKLHERGESVVGVATGFPSLDNFTAGLQPGDLIVLAARPSVGKTSLALTIADNVAEQGLPVVIFSMEMSAAQLVPRMLASRGRIDHDHLRTGSLSDDEWGRLSESIEQLNRASVFIDETPGLTSTMLRARSRRQARASGRRLGLIVVDYLQLMQGASNGRDSTRTSELDQISRELKALAKELQCPVIALSQLNRDVERRVVKRPTLSDIRDSGGIEQAVDVCLMLWHVRGLEPEGRRIVGLAVEKNRNGRRGEFGLDFFGATQRWQESTADINPARGASSSKDFE